jgi:peptidoglycan/xylan/chitin deacetylase (PgdA/CDA1 family)
VLRRIAIALLPLLAAAAIVTVVVRSQSSHDSAAVATTRARRAPAPARHRHRSRRATLPAPPAEVRGAAARRMPIPILMYHVVATPQPGTPNLALWVRPETFEAQMKALRRAGWWAVTLEQAWAAWTRGRPLPRKPVVITFDDGYLGDYTHARPVLRRLGWPGVLNLELRNVAGNNLSARKVRGLIRAGWEIDSHTIDHPDLTQLPDDRLRSELTASRAEIKRRFGAPANFFCYPAGRYDARVQAAVRAAGYRAATTEIEGYARPDQPFALARVRVQYTDTPATLLARLAAERPAG